jgi:hypothetical protein
MGTAIVLKVFAILYFIAGVFATVYTGGHYNSHGGSSLPLFVVVAIEIGATALGTAMFTFFAYVLDLLRGIWEETAGEND